MRMRKFISSIVAIVLVFSIAVPASAITQREYDAVVEQRDALYNQLVSAGMTPCVDITEQPQTEAAANSESADYQITDIYEFKYGYYYVYMAITNTSSSSKQVKAEIYFYDKDNNIVGVQKKTIEVLGNGCETLLTFSNENEYDHYTYKIKMNDVSYYKEVNSFVSVTTQRADNKAIIFGTNEGTYTAMFIEYNVLFLKGDKVVGMGWGYLVDDNSSLEPGETEIREETCYRDFDTIVVYFDGRAHK